MNLFDAIIIILLLIGSLDGARKGVIKSLVELVGSVVVVFLSWILKGVLANVLIKTMPQIGNNPGISVIIYTVISFVVLFIIFTIIYKLILVVTDLFEKILDKTPLLGTTSRVLGALVSFVKTYLIVFVCLFILSSFNIDFIKESKVNEFILEKTPLISPYVKDGYDSIKEMYNNSNIEENIKTLFEKNIITEDNMNAIINKYNENR